MSELPLSFLRATFAALIAVVVVPAQIVTVGRSGSGAQFTSLAAATAAAPAGALVLVAAGTYSEASTVLVDKPLTVLGAGAGATVVEVATPFGAPALPHALRITAIDAGEAVRMSGLRFEVERFAQNVLHVADCAGSVQMADVDFDDMIAAGTPPVLAHVENCALVVFERCTIAGRTALFGAPAPALAVSDSQVFVLGCSLRGGYAWETVFQPVPPAGAPGAIVHGGTLHVHGGEVRGGDGNASSVYQSVGTAGGAALLVHAGAANVRAGSGCRLRGGDGGLTPFGPSAAGGAAVVVQALAEAAVGPGVALEAGRDGDGVVRTGAVHAGGSFAVLSEPAVTCLASASQVPSGQPLDFALRGAPASLCLPLFDLRLGAPFSLPGVRGPLVLAFSPTLSLPLVGLDAGGAASFGVAIPANPQLVGVAGNVQALAFAPGGAISATAPTCFVVR